MQNNIIHSFAKKRDNKQLIQFIQLAKQQCERNRDGAGKRKKEKIYIYEYTFIKTDSESSLAH
jgi:hypothetical protein